MAFPLPPKTARYSWTDTDRFTRALAARIIADGFVPDAIVGILRGGCIPAVHLSHLLKIRPFYAIGLRTTATDDVRAARVQPLLAHSPELAAVGGASVLLVDDVINTGTTMRAATLSLEAHTPRELRTAALIWDRLSPDGVLLDTVSCDYWIESAEAWVVFPWNV